MSQKQNQGIQGSQNLSELHRRLDVAFQVSLRYISSTIFYLKVFILFSAVLIIIINHYAQ